MTPLVHATTPGGFSVTISAVAPARSSGSTSAVSATIRRRCSAVLPNGFPSRAATRSSMTSSGALSSTTASKRG